MEPLAVFQKGDLTHIKNRYFEYYMNCFIFMAALQILRGPALGVARDHTEEVGKDGSVVEDVS
jgi:hypothetical protein